jgi:hypothetical protein
MAAAIQAELIDYAGQISAYATVEECETEEQVLMASMDEVQAHLDVVEYELPKDVEYEGVKYSKKQIASKIIYFLNKIECKWEQTLGLHQLIQEWKREDFNAIPYRVFDSTLRCLNTVTFKGDSEFTDILATNEYFKPCHNEYSLDTGMIVYLGECHNLLLNKMKELGGDVPEELN